MQYLSQIDERAFSSYTSTIKMTVGKKETSQMFDFLLLYVLITCHIRRLLRNKGCVKDTR